MYRINGAKSPRWAESVSSDIDFKPSETAPEKCISWRCGVILAIVGGCCLFLMLAAILAMLTVILVTNGNSKQSDTTASQ
ncbi:unnamed protein product, partial [Rotaria sp. Silwood1]